MARQLLRDKRGMSDVFGSLFFIILILLGFNAMVWSFTQYDQYNTLSTSISLRAQQASSEQLVPTAPGAIGFVGNSFNIVVNNTGNILTSGIRIYLSNVAPGGSTQCSGFNPCIIDGQTPI